jgi:hypothetical protein
MFMRRGAEGIANDFAQELGLSVAFGGEKDFRRPFWVLASVARAW